MIMLVVGKRLTLVQGWRMTRDVQPTELYRWK